MIDAKLHGELGTRCPQRLHKDLRCGMHAQHVAEGLPHGYLTDDGAWVWVNDPATYGKPVTLSAVAVLP